MMNSFSIRTIEIYWTFISILYVTNLISDDIQNHYVNIGKILSIIYDPIGKIKFST